MDEIIDIVDDHDRVVGQGEKSSCIREKLLHRAVNILVFEDESCSSLLLQKRGKRISHAGKLCLPGGHIQAGETYVEGAVRELSEELYAGSVSHISLIELFKLRKSTDDDPEFLMVYKGTISIPPTPDPIEVEHCFFQDISVCFDQAEATPGLFTQTTVLVLQAYRRFLKEHRRRK